MEITELQKDLAATFRWTAKLNMHEAVANHFSACVPESSNFYVNKAGIHFSRMKASDLIFDRSFVEGKWIAIGASRFDIINPANGKKIKSVNDGGVAISEKAIDVAFEAFQGWKKTTAKFRATLLEKWCDLILDNTKALAEIMTLECGKPLKESRGEVSYGAAFVKWFAEEGKRTYGDVIPPHTENRRLVVIKQAVGVVGAITPWNFPINLTFVSLINAISAGNAVLIKPSEITDHTSKIIKNIIDDTFSSNEVNTILGGVKIAEEVLKLKFDHILFIGSPTIGKLIMKAASNHLASVTLELGGKSPTIVDEKVDIKATAKRIAWAKFINLSLIHI